MAAQTIAERQAAFRRRRAETPEVRGIFAHQDDHPEVKEAAAKITKRRSKTTKKCDGLEPAGE